MKFFPKKFTNCICNHRNTFIISNMFSHHKCFIIKLSCRSSIYSSSTTNSSKSIIYSLFWTIIWVRAIVRFRAWGLLTILWRIFKIISANTTYKNLSSIYPSEIIKTLTLMNKWIFTNITDFISLITINLTITFITNHPVYSLFSIFQNNRFFFTIFVFMINYCESRFTHRTFVFTVCSPFFNTFKTKFMSTSIYFCR
jgi:hypothetical protein